MQQLAEQQGSVISATLFGALAAAEVLPFPRDAFEAAIREGGKGVDGSLKGFSAAFARVRQPPPPPAEATPQKSLPPVPSTGSNPKLEPLLKRIREVFPSSLQPMVFAGAKRLIDYQDVAYAQEYLDRMEQLVRLDLESGGAERGFAFALEAAKYLAIAMAYDDVIRVADLKTRKSRFERVRNEIRVADDQIVYTTEFMHPRLSEVLGMLPAALGQFVERRPRLYAIIERRISRPRRVRTGTIFWFSSLYLLSAARFMRRRSLRHTREFDHIEEWIRIATHYVKSHYELAKEVLACRRLVKGYSDTHARGSAKFDRVIAMAPRLARLPEGASWLRRLQQAALLDEDGTALEGAIKTIESFEPS